VTLLDLRIASAVSSTMYILVGLYDGDELSSIVTCTG
jgi:hypothetical protein